MRASSFSARSLARPAVPLPPSSSSEASRARALVDVTATKRRQELLQPSASIAARVDSSDNASSSCSSPPSSSSSPGRTPVANFAVLAAAVAGLAAFGGATVPHAAAAALIDAATAGVDGSFALTSSSLADLELHHLHHLSPSISDLAESEDFWSNLLRYVSFYFSVLLGTAATAARPVVAALKRSPASAAGVVAVALVLGIFVTKTVGAMLGVDDGAPDDLSAFLNSNME